MKSQHTADAVAELARVAPPGIAVACAQNGVANERVALRSFPDVYGIAVMLPATHLSPGVVDAWSTPVTGLLDIGRYPAGVDATAEAVAAAFAEATFDSVARPDVMRWKYRKLEVNLGNAARRRRRGGRAVVAGSSTGRWPRPRRSSTLRASTGRPRRRTWPAEATCCACTRSTATGGRADRRGRASPGERAASRPTTSTARSCCSAASTGCRRR